jgi:hypothetical protein
VVSRIASHCVLSAQALITFLNSETQFKWCPAWWYNVRCKWLSHTHRYIFSSRAIDAIDLHCSASIILLAQLCNFDDGSSFEQLPATFLEQCLQCLSNYEELSSVARKSIKLLKDAAGSLSRSGKPPGDNWEKASITRHAVSQSQPNLCDVCLNQALSPYHMEGHSGRAPLSKHPITPCKKILGSESDGIVAVVEADHLQGLKD